MPMIDLEDCDDAKITDNKTTAESLLKARRSKNLIISGNESGQERKKPEILYIRPGFMGVSIDVKAVFQRMFAKKR